MLAVTVQVRSDDSSSLSNGIILLVDATRVSIVPMGLGGLCSYWFVGSVATVVIDS